MKVRQNEVVRLLARLWADDEGTAAVEFAVLLPVYLLLMVGLLTIGHLVMVRQAVVQATRYKAWEPTGRVIASDAELSGAFFPAFDRSGGTPGPGGTFTSQVTRAPWQAPRGVRPEPNRAPGARLFDRRVQALAERLFENGAGARLLLRSEATGAFPYTAAWLPSYFRTAVFTPTNTCVVLLPNGRNERPAHRSGTLQHPIEAYSAAPNRAFRPSTEPYSSATGAPIVPITIGGPPGIWNPDYRINGTLMTEWAFVKGIAK